MGISIEPRLRAAARKHRSSKSILSDLSIKLVESRTKKQEAEQEIRWCEGFIEFQNRDAISDYQGPLKVFEIEDGETHMVAAASSRDALRFYAIDICGYESVDSYKEDIFDVEVLERLGDTVIPVYDFDDTNKLVVKTAAEWADVDKPCVVSTTAY